MSPLTELIVLLFLLLIALAVVVWWTITAPGRAARAAGAREERATRPPRGDAGNLSNDTVRGARAPRKHAPVDASAVRRPGEGGVTVRPRRRDGEDPFERFLDPERRRRDDSGR